MKITQEEVVERQTVLHIELEDEDLDVYLDRGYRRAVQRTVIPGFRKGKAPRRILENFLGRESLLNEVLDSMLPEVTGRAITEQELDAAGLPRIELMELDPFTVKATVPLTPEIDLGAYRDIRLTRDSVEVTEEDIQERLDQMRHGMASWEPAERAAEMGDMVTMEAQATVEGRTVLDEKDAVIFLDEHSTRPFPGFSQHLVGLVVDEPTEFTLTMPDDYGDDAIAGKEASFAVTVGEIKGRLLPDLDDEFAKGVGDGYESVDALRLEVETELTKESENASEQRYRESIVSALVDGATMELSPVLIEHEVEHMEDNQARALDRVNIRVDDYLRSIDKTEEEMRDEMRDDAVNRLRRSYALSRATELEGIEVSDGEVETRVESIMSESENRPDGVQDSDELKSSVRRLLLVETTMDRLVSIAKGEAPALETPDTVSAKDDTTDTEEETPDERSGIDDTRA